MISQLAPAPSKGGQSRKVRVMGAMGATDNDLMI
jgi:hypothetical protein